MLGELISSMKFEAIHFQEISFTRSGTDSRFVLRVREQEPICQFVGNWCLYFIFTLVADVSSEQMFKGAHITELQKLHYRMMIVYDAPGL